MKRQGLKRGAIFALAGLALVTMTGCSMTVAKNQQELVPATRGEITQSITADGELSVPRYRKLTFRTGGEILAVDVEEGQQVGQGQVLARLDDSALQRLVKDAERAVATAELVVAAAGLAVTRAEVDVTAFKAGIKAAQIDLEQANNSHSQMTYPYTYSTFSLDIPAALSSIADAELKIKAALDNDLGSAGYGQERQQLLKAQDNLVIAREKLARGSGQDVFGGGLLAVKDFWTLRSAQLATGKADIGLTQAENNREKARLALGMAGNDRDKAKLALDRAKSDVETARDELDKSAMRAPFSGTIARVYAKPGQVVSAATYSGEVVMEITDPSRMELVADVDEIDIPGVKPQQRAIISLDALPGVRIEGQVTVISSMPKKEAGVKLYEVKIGFDVPQRYTLKAGMTATTEIIVDAKSDVVLVPKPAITLDSQGRPVVKVVVNGRTTEKNVVTGISNGSQTEISSGLGEGEIVLVEVKK